MANIYGYKDDNIKFIGHGGVSCHFTYDKEGNIFNAKVFLTSFGNAFAIS